MHLIINIIAVDDEGADVDIFMDNDVAAEEEPVNADVENRDKMELRPRSKAELRPVAKPAKPVSITWIPY